MFVDLNIEINESLKSLNDSKQSKYISVALIQSSRKNTVQTLFFHIMVKPNLLDVCLYYFNKFCFIMLQSFPPIRGLYICHVTKQNEEKRHSAVRKFSLHLQTQ